MLLLDTHIALWWLDGGERLTPKQRRATAAAERRNEKLHVAGVTLWEIAMLAQHGRITMAQGLDDFLQELERNARLDVLPITATIAIDSAGGTSSAWSESTWASSRRSAPRVLASSARRDSPASGSFPSARSTSRQMTLPEPSQIEFSGASR